MVVTEFFGIKIIFNEDNEYSRAHFHAEYNSYKILVDIAEYKVIDGYMPKKQLNLILGWCALYEDELMQNYVLMTEGLELNQIHGLEK